jgi:hypothetical protein
MRGLVLAFFANPIAIDAAGRFRSPLKRSTNKTTKTV